MSKVILKQEAGLEMAQQLMALFSFCRGPGFESQNTHGGLQLSMTSVPGAHNRRMSIHLSKTLTH